MSCNGLTFRAYLDAEAESKMTCYAIVKVGNDYVVQVNNRGVMKFTSKRKAIRSVAVAAGLLEQAQAVEAVEGRSLPCGSGQVP